MEYQPYLRHVTFNRFHCSRLSPTWIERVKNVGNSQNDSSSDLTLTLTLKKSRKNSQEPFSNPTRIDEHFDVLINQPLEKVTTGPYFSDISNSTIC